MTNCMVVGYYGFSNFGDDLFVASLDELLNKYDLKVSFLSKPIDGLSANYLIPKWIPNHLYRNQGIVGALFRALIFLIHVRKIDVLVSGGGSVFEITGGLRMPLLITFIKRIFNFQWIAVGVSLPSDGETSKSLKKVLNSIDYLAVRDRISLSIAKKIKGNNGFVSYSGDIASIPLSKWHRSDSWKDSVIGLCISNDIGEQELKQLLGQKSFFLSHKSVVILIANPVDVDISLSVNKHLINMGVKTSVVKYSNMKDFLRVISQCFCVVTSRFHIAFSAYMMGIPFILNEHHEKCTSFRNDVKHTKSFRSFVTNGSLSNLGGQKTVSPDYYYQCTKESLNTLLHIALKVDGK